MRIATMVAAALTASLLTAVPAAATPQVPDRYAQQKLTWAPCATEELKQLECATVTAPLNWNNAGQGKDIQLAISRLKSKNPNPKVLFTNPGGPGVEGRSTPLTFAGRDRLRDSHDIYGIDTRGTGASNPLSCGGQALLGWDLDARDRSEGNIDLLLDSARLSRQYCQVKSGELGKFVNTEQIVKDYDLIRQVLGADKINYVGYSGGTWYGAYYATYFPQRVGRFVLDSNTGFTGTWKETSDAQSAAFERRYREDFLPWVAKYDAIYHQGKTAEEARSNYERLRAGLAKAPLTVAGKPFGPATFDAVIKTVMYAKSAFPELGAGLAELNTGKADRLAQFSAQTDAVYSDSMVAAMYSLMCNDMPWPGSEDDLIRQSGEDGHRYPLVGYSKIVLSCTGWKRSPVQLKHPDGKGVPPVLMVQNERDPATSTELAEKAHREFAGSRMLRVTGEGDHGAYGNDNACVNDHVEQYLIDDKVPATDLSCKGTGLPTP
ncbi:alpha/beta hydrolase [Pseudonocardiaceae bacterium YIM PH 21723]|nr:alpha/beta hydrolase [Pseudonocardiaceae bacterium YIM PH 21723]